MLHVPMENKLLFMASIVCFSKPVAYWAGISFDKTLNGHLTADGTPHQLLTDFDGRAD